MGLRALSYGFDLQIATADMPQPRFCDQCAASLRALDIPHVERPCRECGKPTYLAEPGEGGEGIRIREGDKFTIPAGWLKISLDPRKSRGRFSRHGITWFVHGLIADRAPRKSDEVKASIKEWIDEADQILHDYEPLKHLDLDDPSDGQKAFDILDKQRFSLQWWAIWCGSSGLSAIDSIDDNDAESAVLWAIHMMCARMMMIYLRDLESHIWPGYQHNQVVYSIASAASQTPAEAEKIRALQPIFEKMDESVLHAWVESGEDIAPKIGTVAVNENILKALARYHLTLIERRRADLNSSKEQATKVWANRIAGVVAGGTFSTMVILLLDKLGVF